MRLIQRDLIKRDRASLWHPYAPASATLPLWEVEGADGVTLRLRDDAGRRHEVLDAMSSWWAGDPFGRTEPRVAPPTVVPSAADGKFPTPAHI
ncbi:hypothetical protein [Arthrobacter sp. FW306-2-2C-D06B]|uniref:hypothetical protein n=1 Tax=Arthrobacter sp. FW306-2-2C-D06B TaxID=2879618 RepID=UPI001F1E54ED|nr:hypothetical protein [Arthrobacter sp. FW306-2-2C-D06B]UKA59726.1 hypothetical protein LFT47_05125 [Arthrobacter sp. FW306-2-2C-D06B]